MPQYVLTILDTTGIQNYIFGSNRLKENIGASELVKLATENWVFESLPIPNNVDELQVNSRLHIEDDNLMAEVIYAGGGNALILFADMDDAKAFAAAISKKLIAYAPGINFTIVHTEFNWEAQTLGGDKQGIVFDTFAKLADAKRGQSVPRPLAGLSVSAFCQSTGLPAVGFNEDGNPVSSETTAKLNAFGNVPAELTDPFKMEYDFNKIGQDHQNGKGSYIAVIHADGNNMGHRVEAIAAEFTEAGKGNRAYIDAIRKFSQDVRVATENAVAAMELLLQQSFVFDEKAKQYRFTWKSGNKTIASVPVREEGKSIILPYRRIIVGGDDVTFVCDGRLALTLTAAFLNFFEKEMLALKNKNLTDVHASAGIAVVKTHYPFIRAYKLAEELTTGAKKWVKEYSQDFSAMDWHFAPGGVSGTLDFIREREYRLDKNHTLLMRPIALNSDISWRNWGNLRRPVETFHHPDQWGDKRNKVKTLRELLRKRKDGVKQFVAVYAGTELPPITGIEESVQSEGWASDEHCAYFDAIEAMDFYLPLTGADYA